MQTVPSRSRATAANDPNRDPLITTFLDIDAAERQRDPHKAAQLVCASYAKDLETQKKPRRHLWARGLLVTGLATAALWTWPYIVRSLLG